MHWKLLVALFAFAVAGIVGPAYGQSKDSYESLLLQADSARSSDPKKFAELMDRLRTDKRRVTEQQRQKLRYLQIYEVAVYRDQLGKGVELAGKLFDEAADPDLKYRAGGLIVSFSAINRDFSNGLRYLQKTMAMRKQVINKSIRHEGIFAASLLYNEVGQYEIALRYADEILADSPSPRMLCAAGHQKIVSQFELHQLQGDDASIQRVIDQCSAQKEYIAANIARVILARKMAVDPGLGKAGLEQAVSLLESSLPEVEATRYPRLIAGVHAFIAEFKLKLGDVESAEKHASMTIALGEQIRSSATLVSAYNTLYQIAARHEKPTMALQLYKHYAESEIARQNDVKARELAYEIVRHETLRQTQQIALQDRAIKILQLQRTLDRESAQKARLAMVFLLLLLAAAVFWAIQVKRHQAQLQRLAQTDGLTGLRNRHFFSQRAERTLVEAARAGETAALVMFDLDHFKAINDTYGHGAGDWVLKQVGKTCAAHCRRIDYLSRIGGEEFAVLLRGFDLAAAARMAEDCRSQLAQIDTRESGYSFVVTASFGVSSTAESGYDLSRLLSHADQMLYRAKNEGRNRVCAYTAETAAERRSSTKRSPTLTVVGG